MVLVSISDLNAHLTSREHYFRAQSLIYLKYLLVIKRQRALFEQQQRQHSISSINHDYYYFKCKLCNYQSRTLKEFIANHCVLGDKDECENNGSGNKKHSRRLSKIINIVKRVEGNQIKQLMSFVFGLMKSQKMPKKNSNNSSEIISSSSASSIRVHNEITNYNYLSDCNRLNDDFISREIDFNTKSSV